MSRAGPHTDGPAGTGRTAVCGYESVSVTFEGKQVIRDFSLEVPAGGKVLISGKSGSGKTTLLRLLLGFVQPDSGLVRFGPHPVTRRTVWDIRRRVAYVAQGLDLGSGPVDEILSRLFSFRANAHLHVRREETDSLLTFLELDPSVLKEQYESLSGGEKQRIAVLAGLLLKRGVFLLDEATSALDEQLKEKVVDMFMSNPDWTVLAVSHDPAWRRHGAVRHITMEKR
ncbi:ATP-binding cassette domain-containing protein [bacterium]|nr:ATP-binding cassette domain-containing protein [bacterium]